MIRKRVHVTAEPLESGDRLSREEFHRRYLAMPHLKKAELVQGVVYVPSPAHARGHSSPQGRMVVWVGTYQASTPGVEFNDNGTVMLADDTEVQPDALLRIDLPSGQSQISADDYITGAPELVVEVAASSVSYDLHDKMDAYRDAGVKEYIVWRVRDERIDWFVLRQGQYERKPVDEDGIYRSECFPGLWLNEQAMLRQQLNQVLLTLHQGLASPEHAAFVRRLQQPGA